MRPRITFNHLRCYPYNTVAIRTRATASALAVEENEDSDVASSWPSSGPSTQRYGNSTSVLLRDRIPSQPTERERKDEAQKEDVSLQDRNDERKKLSMRVFLKRYKPRKRIEEQSDYQELVAHFNLKDRTLSKLDGHVLLHYFIRRRQPETAVRLAALLANRPLSFKPKRRRVFAQKTLEALFVSRQKASTFFNTSQQLYATRQGTSEEIVRSSREMASPLLDGYLRLLSILQKSRHRRPVLIYESIIKRCIMERLPDLAAEVYVGLVEEWITEGRVAEGALAKSFYEGGGPPREGREELELSLDLLKTWWKDVRTWALPGEVLSPHDRLDLWHPRKLALSAKLRTFPFPMPTSPPSLVPEPSEDLLEMILDSLILRPYEENIENFERSVRACATLANTIHNRTLPFMSKQRLVDTLSSVPFIPQIFPEAVDPRKISPKHKWAYTAYTHVHLALQSIAWSPPASSNLEKLKQLRAQITTEFGSARQPSMEIAPSFAHQYMMHPLSVPACLALLKYGVKKLRHISAVAIPLAYLSSLNDVGRRKLYNSVLRAARLAGGKDLATKAVKLLFSRESIDDLENKGSGVDETSISQHAEAPVGNDSQQRISLLLHPEQVLSEASDSQSRRELQESLAGFLEYLTVQEDSTGLESLVLRMFPHLLPDGSRTFPENTSLPSKAISPRVFYSPGVYNRVLHGLRVFCKIELAQKVFHHAMLASRPQARGYETAYMLNHSFVTMIALWSDEYFRATHAMVYADRPPLPNLQGYSIPDGIALLPRADGAIRMIHHVYALAKESWMDAATRRGTRSFDRLRAGNTAPDEIFLQCMISACGARWGVDWVSGAICDENGRSVPPPSDIIRHDIEAFIGDMKAFKLEIPRVLELRIMDPSQDLKGELDQTIPTTQSRRQIAKRHGVRLEKEKARYMIPVSKDPRKGHHHEFAQDLWLWYTQGGGDMYQGLVRRWLNEKNLENAKWHPTSTGLSRGRSE